MVEIAKRWRAHAPYILSGLRCVAALCFLEHGSQKLLNFPPLEHPHPLGSMMIVAALIELIGGLLLALGLFTRPAAFLMAGEMAVAYFAVHVPNGIADRGIFGGLLPLANRGDAAVLFCWVFLYLSFAGGGPWSVDAWRSRAGQRSEMGA